MNPNDIRKRQVYVEGKSLGNRISAVKFHRRDANFVDTPPVENIEFDTFFDYEDGLSGLKPSNEQVDTSYNDSMVMQESNHYANGNGTCTASPAPLVEAANAAIAIQRDDMGVDNFAPTAQHGELGHILHGEDITPIIMRPVYKKAKEPPISPGSAEESVVSKEHFDAEKRKYDDVVGFEFVRCEHVMKSKRRCKRQAPKNSTICSIHKKMLNN
jgi:hypothetical protein